MEYLQNSNSLIDIIILKSVPSVTDKEAIEMAKELLKELEGN